MLRALGPHIFFGLTIKILFFLNIIHMYFVIYTIRLTYYILCFLCIPKGSRRHFREIMPLRGGCGGRSRPYSAKKLTCPDKK